MQQTKGLASLKYQHAMRVAQIESRLTRLTGLAQSVEFHELEIENELFERLNQAIRTPSIRTDAAGAIFASVNTPFVR
jgi:hypothetical protein